MLSRFIKYLKIYIGINSIKMDKEDINNYKLKLKTEQAGAFRILIEALKEILTEANFTFDETGIKLMAMDSTHSILIHMKLIIILGLINLFLKITNLKLKLIQINHLLKFMILLGKTLF